MFNKRLKMLREARNLTQKELGEKFNISTSAIGMYEQGRRDPDTTLLAEIADFFGVSTDYLLGKTNELGIPKDLENAQVAFNRGEFEDLTQDEVDALATIAKTLKSQRKGN